VSLAAVWGTLAVEAAFTPRTKAELQGSSTAGLGLRGCVIPWGSGDGITCANADSDVPSGQGDGKYGAIGSWIVSKVTDMGRMFSRAEQFNGDLSAWDVGSVTDMRYMFSSADKFNGDLSAWDVGSVTNMAEMYRKG
jgi:surface protein